MWLYLYKNAILFLTVLFCIAVYHTITVDTFKVWYMVIIVVLFIYNAFLDWFLQMEV